MNEPELAMIRNLEKPNYFEDEKGQSWERRKVTTIDCGAGTTDFHNSNVLFLKGQVGTTVFAALHIFSL